jgi:predicted transcriptional regulator
MTLRWISRHIWSRRLTIHLGSCSMCNDGRGSQYHLLGNSPAGKWTRQWHGPFFTNADAHVAADLLATHDRTDIRECRRCKSGRAGIVALGGDGPSRLRCANPSGHTSDTPYWMKVVIAPPLRATVHLNFCGVVNRGRSPMTSSHGTDVEASACEAGWYGPYVSCAEARSAAVHVQQAGGLIRDCFQCFHASRRYRMRADISPKQRLEPDISWPAVPVDQSVSRDHIICLECGQRTQLLAIHLRRAHHTAPNEYRLKWNLPDTYPMESDGYRRWRSRLYFAAHAAEEQPID